MSFAPDVLGTLFAQLYRKEVCVVFGNDSNCLQRGTAGTEEATSRSPPDGRRARNPPWPVNAQRSVQRFPQLASSTLLASALSRCYNVRHLKQIGSLVPVQHRVQCQRLTCACARSYPSSCACAVTLVVYHIPYRNWFFIGREF